MKPSMRLKCLLVFGLVGLLATEGRPAQKAKTPRAKAKPTTPEYEPITDDPGLPRVLLIGDSISIGYTLPVRDLLKGKANVHRPPTNCGPTTTGLKQIDKWLGDQRWDVIHFNWGLHDLKYIGADGASLADPKAPGSHHQATVEQYEKNLRSLVARLKKTGAKLIWCSTTPVPPGAQGRVVGDDVRYNEVAARVMKENDVPTNDLYAFAKPQLGKIQRPANVHFTEEGSQRLAEEVVKAILAALGKS
jgi:hypothetical protein